MRSRWGCGGQQYCPDGLVTRGQMALFMQRLGDVVAPKVLRADCVRASTFTPLQRGCVIAVDPAAYPRVATANLACGVSSPDPVSKSVVGSIVASTDGGTALAPMGKGSFASLANDSHGGVVNAGSADLAASTPPHVAYEIAHVEGDAAASVTSQCTLVLTVGTRTGPASPV